MRAGITGVTSLLGFNLALRLLENEKWEVYALCRNINSETVGYLKKFPRFHPLPGDVTERSSVEELLDYVGVIFHLAAISSERLCLQKPEDAVKVNVGSTALIAELAGKRQIKMIFASSGAVYQNGYYSREESPLVTNKFYGLTKQMAENLVRAMAEKYDVDYTILRFCRLYGIAMRRNPIYEIFRGWVQNREVTLYEGLDSFLDFLYVKDAVEALLLSQTHEGFKWQTLNVGSGKGIFLRDLVNVAEEVLGAKIKVKLMGNNRIFDVLDSRKIRTLGFSPSYCLHDGLADMKQLGERIGFFL